MRAELDAVTAGFDKMPVLAGAAGRLVVVNAGATALDSTSVISISGTTVTFSGAVIVSGAATLGATTFSGAGSFPLGLVGTPSITFTGDTNTGLWSPGADVLAASTAGVEAWRTNASGNTQFGSSTGSDFRVFAYQNAAAGTTLVARQDNASGMILRLQGAAGADRVTVAGAGNVTIAAPSSGDTLTAQAFSTTGKGLVTGNTIELVGAASNTAIASAYGASVALVANQAGSIHRLFIGDGSGWSFRIASRTGSVTTDRVTFSDFGNVTVNAPSSGNAFTATQLAGNAGLVSSSASGNSSILSLLQNGVIDWQLRNIATVGSLDFYAGSRLTQSIAAGGNVTIAAPASGSTLTLGQFAGSNSLLAQSTLSGSDVTCRVENLSNTANSQARWGTVVAGASAGDPFTFYTVAAVTDWVVGIDNSDSDAFVIANSAALGTTNRLRITTGNLWEFGGTARASIGGGTDTFAFAGTSIGFNGSQFNVNPAANFEMAHRAAFGWDFYTNSGGSLVLRLDASGNADIRTGSGKLLMNGGITRFKSAAQAVRTASGTTEVAHGGPRVPDFVRAVLQCKTIEGNYAVGDEVEIVTISATQDATVMANSTNVGYVQGRAAATALVNKTTGASFQVTPANWDLFLYAHWL